MKNKKEIGWMEVVIQEIFGIDFLSELVDKEVLIRKLADAIGKLEIRELQVLSLYYCDKLTFEEICEVLSISEVETSFIMDVTKAKLKGELIDSYCLATHGFY